MGIDTDSSRVAALRGLARSAGVDASETDLEAVLGFLDRILPDLGRLEEALPPEEGLEPSPDAAPAGGQSLDSGSRGHGGQSLDSGSRGHAEQSLDSGRWGLVPLVERLRARELSPREAVEAYLTRIEAHGHLNAYISVQGEEALAAA